VKIALGVTGCIAAYKAIEVMRGLQKAGASVQVILTRAAHRFVTPLTFEALSSQSVITDMFRRDENQRIQHIRIAQEAQLLAIVPATANILGKFAHGIADDSLSTIYLSCPAPVLLAPAMNVVMWDHPAVRANVEILRARGHHFVDPEPGDLACGMKGEGRLAAVDAIVARILDLLQCSQTLAGVRVLVTAGPTVEDLDPVRFISNRSSGKMGYALAQAARLRGANVTLVSGPTQLHPPAGVDTVFVRSAAEMKEAVLRQFQNADIVIKAAAVGDYRPADKLPGKLKKGKRGLSLALVPTEDILEYLGKEKKHQVLIGFAAETDDLLQNARVKLQHKNLDFIVANDVGSGVFGSDAATVHILSPSGQPVTLVNLSKTAIANRILDAAQDLLATREKQAQRQ
jgi:phosphopantothenoylcysteine decarboxylase / phosphopantothenate---cysteine ligase